MEKTKEEVAIKIATKDKEHTYTSVDNFKPHNWVLDAMQEYADQQTESARHELDKVKKQDEWISVDDKLPKPISIVIIWTTISNEPTLGYYVNDWLYFSVNGNFWIEKEPHIKVLYWMPLPNIPPILLTQFNNLKK